MSGLLEGAAKRARAVDVRTKVGRVVAAADADRLTALPARRALSRRWNLAVRRFREAELTWVVFLGLLTVLIGMALLAWPLSVPVSLMIVPTVVANLLLSPRTLPWFVVFVLSVVVIVVAANADQQLDRLRIVGVLTVFVVGLIILVASFRRSRLGVAGTRGESMLVDLRDRIQRQGVLPPLPAGWGADSELRSAGGTSFAGDFIVAHCHDGRRLDVVVVDVSGKGVQASTRALLLSGALGGLIAAVPAEQLVPAANEYLLARDWEEGFATAAHLSLDLESGDYTVWTAGHPPPVHLTAGSGRWNLLDSRGPVLGLMPDGEFVPASGTMRSGDAMMLYTDGLVETRKFDIGLGIDRLIGQAEQTLRSGYDGAAERLVEVLGSPNDDRALVLIHRA